MTTVDEILKSCPPLREAALSHGTLSYREAGQGPTLVFLHGLAGSSQTWVRQFPAFSAKHRVIAWDAPGFGRSDVVTPDVDVFAACLKELLERLGCGPAALVGHSMGGVVAARLAARHPERVSRLVLSCTHPGYGEPADSLPQPRAEQRVQELATMGASAYGRIRAHGLFPAGYSDEETLGLAAAIASAARPDGIRCSTRMLQLADNRPVLPGLAMPVLVITGERDPVVKPALGAALRDLTPTALRVEMPEVGHAPYLENPAVYNGQIETFLNGG